MKFDVKRTANALGIVGAEAAGLRSNFGSMAKPFTAGHAAPRTASSPLICTALGWTASEEILNEAKEGFFSAAGGAGFDPQAIMNCLGKPWTFANRGINQALPFRIANASCNGRNAASAGNTGINPANIEKVDIWVETAA
jgi:hypothetical protein